MPPRRSEQCAACISPATSRCSACRSLRFCSKRCQSLLWPTHKILCGRDPDLFYLPPLTDNELAMVCANKDRSPQGPGTPTFHDEITLLRRQAGYRGVSPWEDFTTSIMTADVRPQPGVQLLAQARDDRLHDLVSAYRFLASLMHPPFAPGSVERARCAWYFFATSADNMRALYSESWVGTGDDVPTSAAHAVAGGHLWVMAGSCIILNQLYRQLLNNMTLATWAIVDLGSPRITARELTALMADGEQRILEAVDAADRMPQAARTRFRTSIEESLIGPHLDQHLAL
ncbi:hypothetical protein JCM8208_006636 [Rhodotorula glutinis]